MKVVASGEKTNTQTKKGRREEAEEQLTVAHSEHTVVFLAPVPKAPPTVVRSMNSHREKGEKKERKRRIEPKTKTNPQPRPCPPCSTASRPQRPAALCCSTRLLFSVVVSAFAVSSVINTLFFPTLALALAFRPWHSSFGGRGRTRPWAGPLKAPLNAIAYLAVSPDSTAEYVANSIPSAASFM